MIIKNLTINTQAGGKINCPGQLAPHHCNQAYGTERQGIQLNLTCIITVTDATSYSDSLKQVSLTINTQEGGKINRPGQLAPNKSLAPKFRSDIIFSLNDCRMILNSCCLAEKLQNVKKKIFPIFGGGQDKPAWTACPPGVKITRVGGKISRDILPPRGASCPGGQDKLLHRCKHLFQYSLHLCPQLQV